MEGYHLGSHCFRRKTWLNRAQSKLEEVVERHDDDIEQINRRLRYLEDELP